MAGSKIKLKDQLGRVVRVGGEATPGATVGRDLRWPDGTIVKLGEIKNPAVDSSTGGMAPTLWKLIREIPANIQKLAKLAGVGFATRGADGEWYQRSIAEGEGIAVTNGDGVAGDPIVALAELANVGGGALQKTQRDDYGRLAGTSTATTDDLAEGATNQYWKEAPEDGKQYARKDEAWTEVDAISIQFPFYTTSGTFDPVPLTADRELPFFLSNGTQANIPMVTA